MKLKLIFAIMLLILTTFAFCGCQGAAKSTNAPTTTTTSDAETVAETATINTIEVQIRSLNWEGIQRTTTISLDKTFSIVFTRGEIEEEVKAGTLTDEEYANLINYVADNGLMSFEESYDGEYEMTRLGKTYFIAIRADPTGVKTFNYYSLDPTVPSELLELNQFVEDLTD